MKAFKIFPCTSSWFGILPDRLPVVELDRDPSSCMGEDYVQQTLAGALRAGGLWPNGRPSLVFELESGDEDFPWIINRKCSKEEIEEAIKEISIPFGKHAERMFASQLAWFDALARPLNDPIIVEKELRIALEARGLGDWELRRCDLLKDTRLRTSNFCLDFPSLNEWLLRSECTWSIWCDCASREEWSTCNAWAESPINPFSFVWIDNYIMSICSTFAVCDALMVEYASLCGWVDTRHDLLTIGIREAYLHGLAIAIPSGFKELSWAMEER